MRHVESLAKLEVATAAAVHDVARIPPLSHREAVDMATTELGRFLALVESLAPGDWGLQTDCALWDVRQMVAHVAGTAAAYARWSEFKRQGSGRAQRPYRQAGMNKLDAMNQIQVDDRAGWSPAELIAELKAMGPRAIATRGRLPAALRAIPLPLGLAFPFGKVWIRVGYLTDLILTRDIWMHRLDISRAASREVVQTPGHDGRMTALVVRDLSQILGSRLGGQSVVYELAGPAGGFWRIGSSQKPTAIISMDTLDFHRLASGRLPQENVHSLVSIKGDHALGQRALEATRVVY